MNSYKERKQSNRIQYAVDADATPVLSTYLLQSREAARLQVVSQLNRHRVVAQRTEDLVDLADLLLVLQIDRRIEVRHIVDLHLAHQIVLARIVHDAQRDHALRRAGLEFASEAAAAATGTATEATAAAAT